MKEPIYLDHHTVGPPSQETLELFAVSSKEYWGAISSPHFLGQKQIFSVQKSVNSLFSSLGLGEDELFFTTGSAEGFLRVLWHIYHSVSRQTGKTLFWTGPLEECSTRLSIQKIRDLGCSEKSLPLHRNGYIAIEEARNKISSRTALVSFSGASGLTGVIQPIEEMISICREKSILLHVDASYLIGRRFFRFQDLDVDYVTVDGSAVHAPLGTGLLLSKGREATPLPLIPGKEEVSTAAAVVLAQVINERVDQFESLCMETARLRDLFEERLLRGFQGARVVFQEADRVASCSCMIFPGVHAESLIYFLNAKGVYATRGGGKFCFLEEVLQEAGFSWEEASCAVSFSFSLETSESEIYEATDRILACLKQLRSMSVGVCDA